MVENPNVNLNEVVESHFIQIFYDEFMIFIKNFCFFNQFIYYGSKVFVISFGCDFSRINIKFLAY